MNTTLTYKQVQYQQDIKNLDVGKYNVLIKSIYILPIVFVLIANIEYKLVWVIAIVLFTIFVLSRTRYLLNDWITKDNIVGEVKFSKSAIIINEERINLKNQTEIEIIHNFIRNKKYGRYTPVSNGMIQFNLKEGNSTKTATIVHYSIAERNDLEKLILQWIKLGYNVNEFFCNYRVRTIGLKPIMEMSYDEVRKTRPNNI